MKTTTVVLYLLAIAAFEGALYEYLSMSTVRSERTYQMRHCSRVFTAPKKESADYSWYEILASIMHSIWALLIGCVRWMWHGIHESTELIMMLFDESELFQDLMLRFNVCEGPYHLDMG